MELEGSADIDAPVEEAVPSMAEGDIVPELQDFATVGHLYRSIETGSRIWRKSSANGGSSLALRAPRRRPRTSTGRSSSPSPASSPRSRRSTRSSSRARGRAATGSTRTSASSSRSRRVPAAARPESGLRSRRARCCSRPSARGARRGDPADRRRAHRALHDLFNVGYEILLQTFERYFAHTEETDAQLATLAETAVASWCAC